MPAAARRKQRAQRLKLLGQFVREHSWGVMITVLIVIALVLFVCVIAGASPKQADGPQTAQDAAPRYESGFICAITTQVPYYDEDLSQTGTVARGMQITYSTDKSVERDGVRYYLTYFTTLDCGYVSEENLTQDPDAVIAEKVVYVRTPQNLRPAKDSIELGALVEKGTQLQVLGYEGTTNGVVDLYEVSYQGETGYISGQYVATTEEEANEVYDRFGVYAIHAGRGDRLGGGDAESLDYFPREKADFADNKMPNPCYAIYLTCDPAVLADIDKYIEYAKTTKINAFVVNIMDGTSIGYELARVRGIFPHGVPVREQHGRGIPAGHSEDQGRGLLRHRAADGVQRLVLLPGSSGIRHRGPVRRAADGRKCELLAERVLPLRVGVQGRAGDRRGRDHGLQRDPVRLRPLPGPDRQIRGSGHHRLPQRIRRDQGAGHPAVFDVRDGYFA